MNLRRIVSAAFCWALFVGAVFSGCSDSSNKGVEQGKSSSKSVKESKVAVILVNHGSRSEKWRNQLLELEESVRNDLLALDGVDQVKTAFMEYTEPSIATRLAECDAEGITDILLMPVFLTVSSHSFDDIPTITGQRVDALALESLKSEGIETYTPQAKVWTAPLLDFGSLVEKNILRRIKSMSIDPANEGLVFVAYGSRPYQTEWAALMERLSVAIRKEAGISESRYSWCGHIVDYKRQPTMDAIDQILEMKQRAIVLPILVAFDEMFQIDIIGGAISDCKQPDRVIYKADAILPDSGLESWIVQTADSLSAIINPDKR